MPVDEMAVDIKMVKSVRLDKIHFSLGAEWTEAGLVKSLKYLIPLLKNMERQSHKHYYWK